MGLLNDASAWLNGMLGKAAGLSVTYRRGAVVIELLESEGSIWIGDNGFREERNGGPKVVTGERTYLILASAISDDFGEPEEGDRITETIGGVVFVFEIAPGNNGEPAARWSDAERTVWRVNTKAVG